MNWSPTAFGAAGNSLWMGLVKSCVDSDSDLQSDPMECPGLHALCPAIRMENETLKYRVSSKTEVKLDIFHCGTVKMLRCLILSPADFQKNRVNIKNSVYMTITHSSLSGHRKCVPLIVEDSMLLFSGEVPVWGRVSLNTLILIA